MAQTIVALIGTVVEFSQGTLLVASIGFAQLTAASPFTAGLAAVALSAIAVAANVENLAASCGMARPLSEDELQGPTVLSRRRDSTTAPMSWHPRSDFGVGSFTELSVLGPDRYSGRGLLFPPFAPPRYHDQASRNPFQSIGRKEHC